ncbi:MAG: IreB family regulatory phosphoprotein [Clostridia bacterium]|nr:IreB family regulatory phosphoprotein [Clostridia bacterium]
MDYNNDTMKINFEIDKESEVHEIISSVYDALKIKGYDPISQIVGYILSDDPTYITSYNGARSMIVKVERDELLEELVKSYIKRM